MEKYIIEKYKKFTKTSIHSGYRCKTFLLENNNEKYIYQIYLDSTIYQVQKKLIVTNLVKEYLEIKEIPKVIEYGETKKFGYLVIEYKDGVELEKAFRFKNFDYKIFYRNLSKILLDIHSIDVGNKFGWIDCNGLEENEYFYKYIESEINRNVVFLKKYILNKNILDSILFKINESFEQIKKITIKKPVLCWYDINSNNLLVDNNSNITGFLDPGGARYGVREWDIAFIKMDLCRNKKEFSFFEKMYNEYYKINSKLLKMLTIIVELNDIAFQLESKCKLPISFDSNFREEILFIQNNYI